MLQRKRVFVLKPKKKQREQLFEVGRFRNCAGWSIKVDYLDSSNSFKSTKEMFLPRQREGG